MSGLGRSCAGTALALLLTGCAAKVSPPLRTPPDAFVESERETQADPGISERSAVALTDTVPASREVEDEINLLRQEVERLQAENARYKRLIRELEKVQ